MNRDTVLITGASSGIGLALARRFAHHGHPLILNAPPRNDLRTLAADLARVHGVQVRAITRDLTQPEAGERLLADLEKAGTEVEILVNTTLPGVSGRFWETGIREELGLVRQNVDSLVKVTKLLLPAMVERGHGRILNTAVAAADESAGTVYQAARSFLQTFSASLSMELQDLAVSVTVLCHDPSDTREATPADQIDSEAFRRQGPFSLTELARAAYDAVMRGEREVQLTSEPDAVEPGRGSTRRPRGALER